MQTTAAIKTTGGVNVLHLDKEMLGGLECEVGEEKTLMVPVRVTAYGEDGATFEVAGPVSAEEPEPAPEEEAAAAPEGGGYEETAPAVNTMIARRMGA